MAQRFSLAELFADLRVPVIQAPMAGSGINTPELVIAATEAGAMGSLAAAYRTLDQIREDIAAVRRGTSQPFAVNLFAPTNDPTSAGDADAMVAHLAEWHKRFGLPGPKLPAKVGEDFAAKLDLLCELKPAVVSFTFGLLPKDAVGRLQALDVFVMGTATTVRESRLLEESGVDAIIAQGVEAGGHRGSFDTRGVTGEVGLMALLPQVVDAVRIPVVASGGIMDGRGIVAAQVLGGAAVQMGTAFLVTRESGASRGYKRRVLGADDDSTTLTQAFSGRMARGIRNQFMREMDDAQLTPLPYPWQNALTRELRAAGVKADEPEVLSLWAGQGAAMSRERSVKELIETLEEQMRAAKDFLR